MLGLSLLGLREERLFTERNMKNIVIYGYGVFGKMLVESLTGSEALCIRAIIDNGETACDLPYKLHNMDKFVNVELSEIDVIVVTVESAFENVYETVRDKYHLIGLSELFQ